MNTGLGVGLPTRLYALCIGGGGCTNDGPLALVNSLCVVYWKQHQSFERSHPKESSTSLFYTASKVTLREVLLESNRVGVLACLLCSALFVECSSGEVPHSFWPFVTDCVHTVES